jgi:hypothetical protein
MPPGLSFGSTIRTTADKLRFVDKALAKLTLLTPEGHDPAGFLPFLEAIRGLKTRRNAMVLASGLPAEILSDIFMIAVACDKRSLKTNIQVCGHWRAVALGYSRLWPLGIDYVTENPSWTAEMLLRSKQNPISVTADLHETCSRRLPRNITADIMTKNVRLALKHGGRVERLEFMARKSELRRVVQQLHQSITVLDSLVSLALGLDSAWDTTYPLVINRSMPCLRHLHIHDCAPNWSSPVFQVLTRLRISFSVRAIPPISALSDVLADLSNLESLELVNAIPDTTGIIVLPNLRHLSLKVDWRHSGMADCIAPFMTSLSFPASAEVKLCSCTVNPERHASEIAAAVALSRLPRALIRVLFAIHSRFIRFGCTYQTDDGSPQKSDVELHLYYERNSHPDVAIIAQRIVDQFPSTNVIDFQFDFRAASFPDIRGANWVEVLAATKRAESLTIYGDPCGPEGSTLLHALSSDQRLLPRLRSLSVVSVNFKHRGRYFDKLCSLLRCRQALSCGLSFVVFCGCRNLEKVSLGNLNCEVVVKESFE